MSSKHPVHLSQFSASWISPSAKLLCKCSAQTLAHSQFMLISCTPTYQNLSTISLFLFYPHTPPQLPFCNFGIPQHNMCLHHPIPLSANGLFLLILCVWGSVSLPGQAVIYRWRHFVCSLQHYSSCLVILSSTENKKKPLMLLLAVMILVIIL